MVEFYFNIIIISQKKDNSSQFQVSHHPIEVLSAQHIMRDAFPIGSVRVVGLLHFVDFQVINPKSKYMR